MLSCPIAADSDTFLQLNKSTLKSSLMESSLAGIKKEEIPRQVPLAVMMKMEGNCPVDTPYPNHTRKTHFSFFSLPCASQLLCLIKMFLNSFSRIYN